MFAGTVIIVAGVALVTTAKIHDGSAGAITADALPEVESEA